MTNANVFIYLTDLLKSICPDRVLTPDKMGHLIATGRQYGLTDNDVIQYINQQASILGIEKQAQTPSSLDASQGGFAAGAPQAQGAIPDQVAAPVQESYYQQPQYQQSQSQSQSQSQYQYQQPQYQQGYYGAQVDNSGRNSFSLYFLDGIFKKYVDFKGRARRKEYWMFMLFYYVCVFLIGLGLALIGVAYTTNSWQRGDGLDSLLIIGAVLFGLFFLLTFLPCLALTVRRFHDIGTSGLWLLLCLVPYLGFLMNIAVLVIACIDSQPGYNKYGPNPKGIG